MIKIKIIIRKIIFFLLFLTSSNFSFCADTTLPRLWKAVKKADDATQTTFYFLAITHYGLPIEYDEYFERIVLPNFQTADVLAFEGAGGWLTSEEKPLCDSSILGTKEKKVVRDASRKVAQLAMAATEQMHERAKAIGVDDGTTKLERKRVILNELSRYDEFDLAEKLFFYESVIEDLKSSKFVEKRKTAFMPNANESVVITLLKHRPEVQHRDVDSKYGIRRAYCSSGKVRVKYLETMMHLDRTESTVFLKKIPEMELEFQKILKSQPLKKTDIFNGLSELNKTFTCNRNHEWLEGIEAINDGKIYFYALGASHLFPINNNFAHCSGILNELRERGWKIEKVN